MIPKRLQIESNSFLHKEKGRIKTRVMEAKHSSQVAATKWHIFFPLTPFSQACFQESHSYPDSGIGISVQSSMYM